MHLVYTSPNSSMVYLAKNLLEHHGIESFVKGEHLAAAAGGVAPIDAWLELWVVSEYQVWEAREILEEGMESSDDPHETWMCPDCLEINEAPFSHCWKCGTERLP